MESTPAGKKTLRVSREKVNGGINEVPKESKGHGGLG